MNITELKAGTITIKNNTKTGKLVFIYVPNKDSIPYTLAAEATLTVETSNAGESFCYLNQASSDLSITLA